MTETTEVAKIVLHTQTSFKYSRSTVETQTLCMYIHAFLVRRRLWGKAPS